MRKFQKNNVKIILFFLLITSCSYLKKQQKKEVEYIYPPINKFPSVMKEIQTKDGPVLMVELKPESLEFECTLRNDSPYYWCGIDGEIKNPDPKIPSKVTTVYHTVVTEKGKSASLKFVKRLKELKKPVFFIITCGVDVDKQDYTLSAQMFGAYNEYECMEVFGDYSLCPETSKILDIHTGEYVKHKELKH